MSIHSDLNPKIEDCPDCEWYHVIPDDDIDNGHCEKPENFKCPLPEEPEIEE